MNSRSTWIWLGIALVLGSLAFLSHRYGGKTITGPQAVLTDFKAATVSSVEVLPAGALGIRADHTNATWQLTKPIVYPAQAGSIESLLNVLERLAAFSEIDAAELRRQGKGDGEYGLENPQFTLVLHSKKDQRRIKIGSRTAFGDQVYLQVVGMEGVKMVDATLLKLIPTKADDWRDTGLVNLEKVKFDRVAITNGATVIELQFNATNNSWTMLRPVRARADTQHIGRLLLGLHHLRVEKFVSDDPQPDLEPFGLRTPEMTVAFARGSNQTALLQFGKSPANNPTNVFARRHDLDAIVEVPKAPLPWQEKPNDFRDRRVLNLRQTVDHIEVRGNESFSLIRESSNSWRTASQEFPVDNGFVEDFIHALDGLRIVEFIEPVTDADLPVHGLAPAARQIILSTAMADGAGTNQVIAELSLGKTNEDKVLVRRADENPVYAVALADIEKLPMASWQLRERRIWSFTTNDVARLVVRQAGKSREISRSGPNSWALTAGSGIITPFAIEEAAFRFGEMAATLWVQRDAKNLSPYGISTNSLTLEFQLKNNEKCEVTIGGISAAGYPFAATQLGEETWVFELPLSLMQMLTYLALPADKP